MNTEKFGTSERGQWLETSLLFYVMGKSTEGEVLSRPEISQETKVLQAVGSQRSDPDQSSSNNTHPRKKREKEKET